MRMAPYSTEAACVGTHVDFYAEIAHRTSHSRTTAKEIQTLKRNVAPALELCASCPILEPCREWGIENERWGIWGGTLPHERVAIRKIKGLRVLPK